MRCFKYRDWLLWCAGWLIFSLLASEATAAKPWLHADTQNFEVLTNSRASEARVLVGRLEEFRENFLRIFPGSKCREPRVTVVIFDTDRDFRPYKPLYKGKPAELAGVFQGFPDEVVIALTAERDLEQTIPVIFHEYVHMLLHARGLRLPPWLNEGMAELYSTIEMADDQLKLGKDIPHHLMLLHRNALMPLSQLFSVTQASPDYNEGTRRSLFYAQSWALLHYWDCGLAKDPQQFAKKGRFLELLQTGRSAEDCMQEAFGKSLADTERELAAYVRGGKYYLRSTKIEKIDYAARVEFRPATDFERDVALANLKWRLQRNGDATYQMLQFAEQHPDSPRPFELLAAMAMIDREHKRAVDYWNQAASRKSANPYVYEQLARDSIRQYMVGLSLNFRLPEEASAELRGWLDRALELEPDYAEVWDWLALTEAFSKKMRIAVVNKAVARRASMMSRPRYLAAIALIALRQGNEEVASDVTELLLARPDVMKATIWGAKTPPIQTALPSPSASPWMQPPESYPDVQYVARTIERKLRKKKGGEGTRPVPGGAGASSEPAIPALDGRASD